MPSRDKSAVQRLTSARAAIKTAPVARNVVGNFSAKDKDMNLGQINFGPVGSGRFDYEVQLPSIDSAARKVIDFMNQTDEKLIIDYLSRSNRKALVRLHKLIEDALKLLTTSTTPAHSAAKD